MSNTSTGNNTMNKSTPAPKRVSKKSDATPVAATPVVEKVTKKTKPVPVVETVPVEVAPVEVAPVATAVLEAVQVEVRSVEQEIASLIASHQKIRDEAVTSIKSLQKLQKRIVKEVKDAGRRRRRSKRESEDGTPREKRPTIFTTPVTLKDELCAFLGKSKGSQMTPAEVTKAFSAYVDTHKLKDVEKGHTIHPDSAMRKVLGVKEDESVTYRNIQAYLYKLYILPEKKKPSSS